MATSGVNLYVRHRLLVRRHKLLHSSRVGHLRDVLLLGVSCLTGVVFRLTRNITAILLGTQTHLPNVRSSLSVTLSLTR